MIEAVLTVHISRILPTVLDISISEAVMCTYQIIRLNQEQRERAWHSKNITDLFANETRKDLQDKVGLVEHLVEEIII